MGRKNYNAFIKKQKEERRRKKKEEKKQKKEARRSEAENEGTALQDMLAYVDENGNITTESPEEREAKAKAKAEAERQAIAAARKAEKKGTPIADEKKEAS